jgi:hypothetical protein
LRGKVSVGSKERILETLETMVVGCDRGGLLNLGLFMSDCEVVDTF